MTRTIKLVCLRDACPHPEANTTCSVCGRRPTFDEDGHWSVQQMPPAMHGDACTSMEPAMCAAHGTGSRAEPPNGMHYRADRLDDLDRPLVLSPTPFGRFLDRLLGLRIDAVRAWNGLRGR
jgi:hypothetical protein